MFIEAKDDGSGGDNWSYRSCKAPVKSSPPTNQHPVFLQAGCRSCHPNNSNKALKGKMSHPMDLLTPNSSGGLPTLSLTSNGSWLPWGRFAMPLISPLMPVTLAFSIIRCNSMPHFWDYLSAYQRDKQNKNNCCECSCNSD